ncbi:ATP-binding protein [Bacteroidota bacterium]
MRKLFFSAALLILSLFLAMFYEFEYYQPANVSTIAKKIQRKINKKETSLNLEIQNLLTLITFENFSDLVSEKSTYYNKIRDDKGLSFIVYQKDSVIYWTNHAIPFSDIDISDLESLSLKQLKNGYYLIRKVKENDIILIGFALIKNNYEYENAFLENTFHKDFNMRVNAEISFTKKHSSQDIYSLSNTYLFSLDIQKHTFSYEIYISILFYLISFLSLLYLLFLWLKKTYSKPNRNLYLLALTLFLLLFRFILFKLQIPKVLHELDLFKPNLYSNSIIFHSLGDLLIHSIVFLSIGSFFNRFFQIRLRTSPGSNLFTIFAGFIITFCSFGIAIFLKSLILDSVITFELYKLLDISTYSIIGLLTIGFFFHFLISIAIKFIEIVLNHNKSKLFLGTIGILSFIFYFVLYFNIDLNLFYLLFYWFLIITLIYYKRKNNVLQLSNLFVIVLIISSFTVIYIEHITFIKSKNESKVLAVNLANERDQIAELLLTELEVKMNSDSTLIDHLKNSTDELELIEYITQKYFNGYFKKYDLQIVICEPDQDLWFENSQEYVNCYSFFNSIIRNSGIKINNSSIYYIDNISGRISYIGKISYFFKNREEKMIYFSIDSKLVTEQLGYPELLLEGKRIKAEYLKNYSYAKYFNGQLMMQEGEYPYNLNCPFNCYSEQEFQYHKLNEYNHLVYKPDEENSIILSYRRLKAFDILISFTYLFILYYLLFFISNLIRTSALHFSLFRNDFKNRIKFSMVALITIVLLIVATGIISYNISRYEETEFEDLSEKIQSVLIELEHKIGYESRLDDSWSEYLTNLLRKFSNVFFTDINLYNINGQLLASSRPELFEKGLISQTINRNAYENLIVKREARFIHKEQIGKLSYISAYVPLKNIDNELLAYLNLPYFTRQDKLTYEIYTLVVAIINIFALLIVISIITAVFLTDQITWPLKLIQIKIRDISLKKENEKIEYESNDEIGSLVKDYNRMVEELDNSAKMLAQSERETAWREMAKQIAHEIKNPLTPMKLSIQQLQKAWKHDSENWDKQLENTAKSLIEQIDNLSHIATEFSSFAKIPKAITEKLDLISILRNSISLFDNIENLEFNFEIPENENFTILADKEQLKSLFSNLIKNSIQAIPKNKNGKISIRLKKKEGDIKISIKDNGLGIKEEIKEKLFQPNFTTKTSGMGLGLSIVKNIIEGIGGNIWYETEIGKGTTFYISVPDAK